MGRNTCCNTKLISGALSRSNPNPNAGQRHETWAAIKNPPIVCAKQANISNGPQQVNNGIPAPSYAGETFIEPSKLSGGGNELCQNTGAPALTGRVDKAVETVGAIHGAKVASG